LPVTEEVIILPVPEPEEYCELVKFVDDYLYLDEET